MATGVPNRRLLIGLTTVAVLMFGFGYLLWPVYAAFCRFTGLNQPQPADEVGPAPARDSSRSVLMQFDSNLRDDLPLQFHALQSAISIHPGELVRVAYEIRNDSDRMIIGQAVASYAPEGAAVYVRKLECFCFSTQKFLPHEVRRMLVVLMIDPSLPREVTTLTLSYTFFDVGGGSSTSGSANT